MHNGVRSVRVGKRAWIAFRGSGFATGLAPHRTHGQLTVDETKTAEEQMLRYYELAGRPAVGLEAELRRRCKGAALRCAVPWTTKARFRP